MTIDWGYIAGYFDGEGTVEFYRSKARGAKCMRCGLEWANTNLESLVEVQKFLGAGRIRPDTMKGNILAKKQGYGLYVQRRNDILRIGKELLKRCLIKHNELKVMLEYAQYHRQSQKDSWGRLAALGINEVRRLYWDKGMTQKQIGESVGVTQGAVRVYMNRHGIPVRPPSRGQKDKTPVGLG